MRRRRPRQRLSRPAGVVEPGDLCYDLPFRVESATNRSLRQPVGETPHPPRTGDCRRSPEVFVVRSSRAVIVSCVVASSLAIPSASRALPTPSMQSAAIAAAAPSHHAVGHRGRWLTDNSGRVVEVHGVNLVIKRPPYRPAKEGISADDARFLHRHGFNAVRLGVLMEALEPTTRPLRQRLPPVHHQYREPAGAPRDPQPHRLPPGPVRHDVPGRGAARPGWSTTDGIPNAPSLGFPGNYFANEALARAFDNFWANAPGPKGTAAAVLVRRRVATRREAAARRRRRTRLRHLQRAMARAPDGRHASRRRAASRWTRTSSRRSRIAIITAIHQVDPHHLAFYEPWQPFSESAPTYLGSPGDDESGFSFHTYCAAALGAPETAPSRAACDLRRAQRHRRMASPRRPQPETRCCSPSSARPATRRAEVGRELR